jgi:hypothetical protein
MVNLLCQYIFISKITILVKRNKAIKKRQSSEGLSFFMKNNTAYASNVMI